MLFPLMAYRGRASRSRAEARPPAIHRNNYEFFPPAHWHPVPSLCRLLPVLITYLADSERMHTTTAHPAFYKRLLIAHTHSAGSSFYKRWHKI